MCAKFVQLKQEKERFSQELANAKDDLRQEHEAKMQQLQTEYENLQNELRELKEEQVGICARV